MHQYHIRQRRSPVVPFISLLVLTFYLDCIVTVVRAKPFTFLFSSKPACVHVELPANTKILINYYAPDLIVDKEVTKKDPLYNKFYKELGESHLDKDSVLFPNDKDETELSNAKSRKEKLQAMVSNLSSQNADMTISISKKRGRALEKFDLTEIQSTLDYTTEEDGILRICTQSIMASRNNPRRISLDVFIYKPEIKLAVPDHVEKVSNSLSIMESQLQSIYGDMENLLRFAEFDKHKETEFEQVNRDMNNAAKRWPMFHLGVLFVAGFMQMKYMMSFFKNRHLI